jgi:hypothetical protein
MSIPILLGTFFVASIITGVILTLQTYEENGGYWWWTETAKAIRERNAKRDRYVREYLGYGFEVKVALQKANAKIDKEAKEADEVKP